MAKLRSSLLNMFLSLTLICVGTSAILAYVNQLTLEPIVLAKKQKLENAIKEVLLPFDNSPTDEMYKVALSDNDTARIYPARMGEKEVGIAVETQTMNGFSGEIKILTGLTSEGEIINYEVLSHSETPGLGDKMTTWFKTDKNKQSILGRNIFQQSFKLSKDGGDVDAITAATISSRAFIQAINKVYLIHAGKTDAESSATTVSDATTSATTQSDK